MPSRAITSGCGGPAGSSREALAGAGAAAGRPAPPNAERSSVTSATTAIATRTARRRRRRSRSRCRRRESSRRAGWRRGRHAGHRSEPFLGVQPRSRAADPRASRRLVPERPESSASAPSTANDQSQSGGLRADDARCSIGRVSAPARPPRIEIPRWIQLVGLPLLLVLAWVVASAAAHVVFLFLIAALIALLLDPIVRALQRARLPRGLSVAIVYLTLRGCAWADHRRDRDRRRRSDEDGGEQVQRLFHACVTDRPDRPSADRDVDRLQQLARTTHRLKSIKIAGARAPARAPDPRARRRQVHEPGRRPSSRARRSRSARRSSTPCWSLVISIYMLLDMQRLGRAGRPALPAATGRAAAAPRNRARARVVRARAGSLLSLIIGASAGIGF